MIKTDTHPVGIEVRLGVVYHAIVRLELFEQHRVRHERSVCDDSELLQTHGVPMILEYMDTQDPTTWRHGH